MSPAADAWSIPSRHDRCTRCDTELPVGSRVTVALAFGQDGPRREDLCTTCGQSVEDEESSIFWRQERVEDGDQRPVVDYAFLREMFGRMLEREEQVYRRLSYLVGLVLVRKRYLRLKGFERRGDREVMVVTRGADHPLLDVPAPHLSPEDMVETREMLKRLLSADLPEGDLLAPDDGGAPEGSAAPQSDEGVDRVDA